MFIENLEINNFRNIKSCIFEPGKNINIIFGSNANGKTSLIESIYAVSNLKSFRTSNLQESINFNSSSSFLNCNYFDLCSRENIKLKVNKNNKKYTKNDKTNKVEDYLWSLFTIVFLPDDILLVNGSPSKRRELIDKAIFFTNKEYLGILKKYYKILANKNVNLKNKKYEEIDNWNILVAKYSSLIVSIRNKYIDKLNSIISLNFDSFKYRYEITKLFNFSESDLYDYFIDQLKINMDKEIKYKYSIVGAHRQSIDFSVDNKNLKLFGSQGQKKSFLILLRAAQIVDFEKSNKRSPILLLDDMASELDAINKNSFYDLIKNFKGQTFITTTDKSLFSCSNEVKYFCVENGSIKSFS